MKEIVPVFVIIMIAVTVRSIFIYLRIPIAKSVFETVAVIAIILYFLIQSRRKSAK